MATTVITTDEPVIELRGVSKSYSLEQQPWRRLWGQLSGRTQQGPQYHALQGVDLQVRRGEVVGVVGKNGAGKSTLLQLICGVLEPSAGQRQVRGRVAALLELGAGFNPELTGRENVRLNGPLLGLANAEVERRMGDIIQFAGIGEFIDQPVRSYSSGMFMRLAFSMATSMDPEILVIDEALSVGDGAFARKSFDRIMTMKERGVTILFCSHSTYHIESICSRAVWLDQGRLRMNDEVARVVAAYNDFITAETAAVTPPVLPALLPALLPAEVAAPALATVTQAAPAQASMTEVEAPPDFMQQQQPFRPGHGRVLSLLASADGPTGVQSGRELKLHTGRHRLTLTMEFLIDPLLPAPTMIIALYTRGGVLVASAGSHNDGHRLQRDAHGQGRAVLSLPALPLLKGEYYINVILACERGLHYYENVMYAVKLDVTQDGLEQGFVTLEHAWS